jgi:hypothetical protein
MAMTFTLVSHLRERLSELIRSRQEERQKLEAEKERLALEVRVINFNSGVSSDLSPQEEEARTRGTPVNVESFKTWKANFDREQAQRKAREEEEIIKGMIPKEREEWRKLGTRLTGKEILTDLWPIVKSLS